MAKTPLETFRQLAESSDALEDPAVELVKPTIRSGIEVLFRDVQKLGVAAEDQEVMRAGLEEGWLLGSFLVEWGYDVPHERAEEYRRWLIDNEQRLAATQPEGVQYRGTYAVSFGSERSAGLFKTLWQMDSYHAFKTMSQAVSETRGEFSRLLSEMSGFRDRGRGAPQSSQIFIPAAGAHRF